MTCIKGRYFWQMDEHGSTRPLCQTCLPFIEVIKHKHEDFIFVIKTVSFINLKILL